MRLAEDAISQVSQPRMSSSNQGAHIQKSHGFHAEEPVDSLQLQRSFYRSTRPIPKDFTEKKSKNFSQIQFLAEIHTCASKVFMPLKKCACSALFKNAIPFQIPEEAKQLCVEMFERKSVNMRAGNSCAKFRASGKLNIPAVAAIMKKFRDECLPENFKFSDFIRSVLVEGMQGDGEMEYK